MDSAGPPRPSPREMERLALNINPGGWSVQDERPIATLLGSCVAVCLFDPVLHLGGMNHFLLPSRSRGANAGEDVVLNGDYAMEVLVNAMLGRGARKERLVAKAFGGGTIVSSIHMAIGERNSEFARTWLNREHIPLIAEDFGGAWSRKVILDPVSGDAFCRRQATDGSALEAVVRAEAAYENSLNRPKPGDGKRVELF